MGVTSHIPDEERREFGEGGEGVGEEDEGEIHVQLPVQSTREPVARIVECLHQTCV